MKKHKEIIDNILFFVFRSTINGIDNGKIDKIKATPKNINPHQKSILKKLRNKINRKSTNPTSAKKFALQYVDSFLK